MITRRFPAGSFFRLTAQRKAASLAVPGLWMQRHYFSATRSAQTSTKKVASKTAARLAHMWLKLKTAGVFSFWVALIVGGIAITGMCTIYFIEDMLLPNSDVYIFQKAVGVIDKDERVHELLGEKLKAHGEPGHSRWASTRPVAARRYIDTKGREHVLMQFHVDGNKAKGIARLELIEADGEQHFRYLLLDVPGEPRYYLINEHPKSKGKKGFLGIQWGPRS